MKLHSVILGEGEPMVIVHGLFGSADNWQTIGKKFAEKHEVHLIDLRNHGHSPFSDDLSYDLMAEDLHEYFDDHYLRDAVLIGHSMGGKTAMFFAQEYSFYLSKLIIADIGVKQYPMHHQQVLAGMNSVDLSVVKSRKEAHDLVAEHIQEESIIQFILKNLYWIEKGKLSWRFNLPVLENKMNNILTAVPQKEVEIPTLFLYGENSKYVLPQDQEKIQQLFLNSIFIEIKNAGHWLHAENPQQFFDETIKFLKDNEAD